MKIIKKLLIASGLLFMCSCTSTRHTADVTPVKNTVVSLSVADMNISTKKVSKTSSWRWNPLVHQPISILVKNTEAQLLNEANADVLVEPQYIIEKRGFFRGGTVTVTGFPARFKEFHKMTPTEAEIIGRSGFNPNQERGNCKKVIVF